MDLKKQIKNPGLWDRFGIFYFAILFIIGVWILVGEAQYWMAYVLIFMGISGFIVDFSIVYRTYLKRKLK
jgi:hypothetical protein